MLEAFTVETRLAARLNHPNILAIHDLVSLPDGRPAAILPRVEGVDLEELLSAQGPIDQGRPEARSAVEGHPPDAPPPGSPPEARRAADAHLGRPPAGDQLNARNAGEKHLPGHPPSSDRPGRLTLLRLFQQVCLALDHAHTQGVIHCDVKPSNVLCHLPGPAYVTDWGVAVDLRARGAASGPDASHSRRPGGVGGTVSFASPEQLRGDWPTVAVDIYGLGALLYYLLTGSAPFHRDPDEDLGQFLRRRQTTRLLPLRERAPTRDIPLELEALCLQCLFDRPERRPRPALMVHDAVTAYLEGVQLLAHRRSAAAAVLARARQARERFEALQGDLETARRALQAIRSNLDPFSPRNEKEVLWLLEDRREALAREHDRCFREAANLAHQALELDPELPEARRALVGLYVERLDQIEQQGNLAEQPLLESLIQRYDDGTYGARLSATATVTVRSDLPGMVTAYRLVEDERRLRPADEHPVGETPVTATLEPGRWLLMVKRDGCLDARYPLRVRRGQHLELNAWLPLAGEIPPDFLYVPAGAAPLGGDPEAFEEELTEIEVPAFAIARHPVTCGEYLEFLNALIHHAPEEARRRVPRGPNRAPRWLLGSDGRYRLPLIDAEGDAITARQPVMLVNAWDAEAYCAWRSGRYGLPFRLPTPAEWEKAARGADGRFFPWGDRFDASFCNSRPARGVRPRLEPVGTFPEDTSPYGVMEMAGGVSELTAGQGEHPRRVCGGAFFLSGPQCRLARRVDQAPDQEAPSVGFRICFSLNR